MDKLPIVNYSGHPEEIRSGDTLPASILPASSGGGGMPYYVSSGTNYTNPINIQGLIAMNTTIDGFIQNGGYIIEVN